jgi:hypothetical protein
LIFFTIFTIFKKLDMKNLFLSITLLALAACGGGGDEFVAPDWTKYFE